MSLLPISFHLLKEASIEQVAASRRPVTGANRVRGDRGWFVRAGRRLAAILTSGRWLAQLNTQGAVIVGQMPLRQGCLSTSGPQQEQLPLRPPQSEPAFGRFNLCCGLPEGESSSC